MTTVSMHHSATSATEAPVIREKKPFTMRDAQLRMIPIGAIMVFALTAIGSYVTAGELGEAIGLGAFMAFWIGGGFGAIMGGALWNHHNEASLYKN